METTTPATTAPATTAPATTAPATTAPATTALATTAGTLLGGRVAYRQPTAGYRTGIEPVLIAAHCPARPGDRVLEAGCGAGAGLLCLMARVPGVMAEGVEIDPAMAALARVNTGLTIHEADIATLTAARPYDHAFTNPPWRSTASTAPAAGRALALQADPALLGRWLDALARLLRPRGTVTLVQPAAQLSHALGALRTAQFGAVGVTPLWPRAGLPAKLVLLRATRGARGPDTLHPGLVLHDGAGYSGAAQAVLRDGAAID